MSQIMKTDDYSKFKKHQQNRPIDQGNLKKIKNSIRINNLLELRPILVNAKMEVIDGQHRLEAAKDLGIEIYYQVEKNIAAPDIIRLNTNQKSWTSENYLDFYVAAGNVEYLKIKEFIENNNITIREYLGLTTRLGGSDYSALKAGELQFMSPEREEEARRILGIKAEIKEVVGRFTFGFVKHTRAAKFNMALTQLMEHPEIDLEVLKNKITIKADAIKQCATTASYYELLKNIYNWKNQNPID